MNSQPHLQHVARAYLARRFVAVYGRHHRVSRPLLRYYEVVAALRRLIGSFEDRPVGDLPARGLSSPEYETALLSIIRARTGVSASVPAT